MKYSLISTKRKYTHTELTHYLVRNPKTLHPLFKPIRTELIVLRGRVDLIGSINGKYCIVEVKIDNRGTNSGKVSEARRQLIKYAKAFNNYHSVFNLQPIDYIFIIVRLLKTGLEILYFEDMDDLRFSKTIIKGLSYKQSYKLLPQDHNNTLRYLK